MKSAYATLGIPGNAGDADIETAFQRALALYTPQRLADDEDAVDRRNELQMAYDVLRKPDLRMAHDRKLAAAVNKAAVQRRVVVQEEVPAGRKFLVMGMMLLGAIFAAGLFVSYRNAEARKHEAVLELAARQQAAQDEERKRLDADRAEQERIQAKNKAEAEERRFAAEGQLAGARANMDRARQEAAFAQTQRAALADAQRQEAALRMQEQRNVTEALRRTEMDKRRVRELCYQQYRRYDC